MRHLKDLPGKLNNSWGMLWTLKPSGTEDLGKQKKDAFDLLRNAKKKGYCSVYKFKFQDKTGEDNGWVGEDVTECFILVFADPSYNTRRKLNIERASYEKLALKQMSAFAGLLKMFWHVADKE